MPRRLPRLRRTVHLLPDAGHVRHARAARGLPASFSTRTTAPWRSAGSTPELRCNRAHGLHMFEHRLEEAEAEFQQTLRGEADVWRPRYVRIGAALRDARPARRGARAGRRGLPGRPAPADAAAGRSERARLAPRVRQGDRRRQQGRGAAPVPADRPRRTTRRRSSFPGGSTEALAQYQLGIGDVAETCRGCARSRGRAWPRWVAPSDARAILDELEHLPAPSTSTRTTWPCCATRSAQRGEALAELERARRRELGVPLLDRRRSEDGRRSGTIAASPALQQSIETTRMQARVTVLERAAELTRFAPGRPNVVNASHQLRGAS